MSNIERLIQKAAQLHKAGKLGEATSLYLQVLKQEPDNFDALQLSGAVALEAGDPKAAAELIAHALERGRKKVDDRRWQATLGSVYSNLAIALQRQRKFDDALAASLRALSFRDDDAALFANAGLILKELGRYEEAEVHLRRAIRLNPRQGNALSGLGIILYVTMRFDEAESVVDAAIEIDARDAAAHSLRANILTARGDPELALQSFDCALRHDPTFADALHNRALLRLGLHRFGDAWPDLYRYHPIRRPSTKAQIQQPFPVRIGGKHVVINRSQGIGDELFFWRFIPLLKARGVRITYRTEPRMMGFAARLAFIDDVVSTEVVRYAADYSVPVDTLPYMLQLGDADVSPSVRLPAKSESLRRIAVRLQQAGPPPYLGVTWRAGRMRGEVDFRKEVTEILFKDIPPELLAQALRQWPGTILILQRNPAADELVRLQQALQRQVVDCSEVNNDLEDMLALVSLIERYVTVSNTNLHLRAAAGLPSHVLVPWPPEWRWGFGPERSPWFPDCSVFRQDVQGDWQAALKHLGDELLR